MKVFCSHAIEVHNQLSVRETALGHLRGPVPSSESIKCNAETSVQKKFHAKRPEFTPVSSTLPS